MSRCPFCSDSLPTERKLVYHLLAVHGCARPGVGVAEDVRRVFDIPGWSLYTCFDCGGWYVDLSFVMPGDVPGFGGAEFFDFN